ncbi:cell division protein ZipA C-terminal FtsZ-binding domain-containing protein [Guyparkeria sp. GHLCS8-2]|uniref:cell division protein ZipA C-terminal FtsZ-binding domain-containing protein n=1 Tax=Guyparkeria halopsychrophila TaxID=3139421 RepID=UPI0037CB9E61
MEWLRWIVLLVGLLVIGGIVWMYRRHRSEQAVDLGGGQPHRGEYHDPIDASVGASVDAEGAERARGERREPQLELGEERADDGWSRPDADGFIDGASAGRVVWRAPEADDEPERPSPAASREEPALEPEPDWQEPTPEPPVREEPPAEEEAPARDESTSRPQPGFSSLFTRQGQTSRRAEPQTWVDDPAAPASGPHDAETVSDDGSSDADESSSGAVISMMIVDREQAAMPPERVRRAIEDSGFEFGEFAIYHFQDIDGADWFSLMNAVSPGQFNPDDLTSFETPALALFMQLPVRGGADPSLVFERMHQVATSLAEALDAMLIDDRREPLDSESIDRYRELIDNHG